MDILILRVFIVSIIFCAGCASLPSNDRTEKTYSITAGNQAPLSQLSESNLKNLSGDSGFIMLGDGLDAFIARMALVHEAEKSIDAQYYIWHDDLTGKLLLNELVVAADRGVRVRLLLDDINLTSAHDKGLVVIATHPNISVRIFNPFSRNAGRATQLLTRYGDVTRRMHNKSFIADGRVSIIGGRNIGNEYFNANPVLEFGDLDVLAIGQVVPQVTSVYDLYWNNSLAYPIEVLMPQNVHSGAILKQSESLKQFVKSKQHSPYANRAREAEFLAQLKKNRLFFHSGEAEVFYDLPDKLVSDRNKTELHLSHNFNSHTLSVKDELLIITPYFVPGKEGIAYFKQLEGRGVDVKILTNSLASTDVSVVHAGYKLSRKELLKAGVELYELKAGLAVKQTLDASNPKPSKSSIGSSKASLHAKTFALDRQSLFIGSLNLDPRSFVENTEVGMLIRSPDIAGMLGELFDRKLLEVSYQLTWDERSNKIIWVESLGSREKMYDYDPHTSWWLRRWVDFMSLFPIESQI